MQNEKECYLGSGVAMVTPLKEDDTPLPSVVVRCAPFNHTSKVMIGVDDFKWLLKSEIDRVKYLSACSGYWVESTREENMVYRNDHISHLKGIGKKTGEVVATIAITTINNLTRITSVDSSSIE